MELYIQLRFEMPIPKIATVNGLILRDGDTLKEVTWEILEIEHTCAYLGVNARCIGVLIGNDYANGRINELEGELLEVAVTGDNINVSAEVDLEISDGNEVHRAKYSRVPVTSEENHLHEFKEI